MSLAASFLILIEGAFEPPSTPTRHRCAIKYAAAKPSRSITLFSGASNLLSNLFPCTVFYQEHRYTTAVQAIHAAKADLYGDDATLMRVRATNDPMQCLQLGKQVIGFKQGPSR